MRQLPLFYPIPNSSFHMLSVTTVAPTPAERCRGAGTGLLLGSGSDRKCAGLTFSPAGRLHAVPVPAALEAAPVQGK